MNHSTKRAIGLMSGTSMDGVDAAVLSSDGLAVADRGPSVSMRYDEKFRKNLRTAVANAKTVSPGGDDSMKEIGRRLTELHAAAVAELLSQAGLRSADIDIIGFHGHTVDHRPEQRFTWQIGDGQLLANTTGIDVVCDFRSNDVAHGGQGAPLLPLYHAALIKDQVGAGDVVALLNIGGVANITWMDFAAADNEGTPDMLAFDTGPGNALIDDWMRARLGRDFDEDGALAAAGQVDTAALNALMDHDYFARTPPKSLDRDAFSLAPCEALADADGAATLTAFTAESVRRGLSQCRRLPTRIYVTGGGRHNPTLMQELHRRTGLAIEPVEGLGLDGDAMEAEGFAFLAIRSLKGLPISLPGTTGVDRPRSGGVLFRARQ